MAGLAELAYSAALDDDLWTGWTEAMMRHFGAAGSVFGLLDVGSGEIRRGLFLFPDRDIDLIVSEYAEQMGGCDPVLRRLRSRRSSEIFDDRDAYDPESANDRHYREWEAARIGISHNLTASVALGDGLRAGIALNWSSAAAAPGRAERKQFAALFPHVCAAMKLGLRHHHLLQAAWWDGIRSREAESAAVLLDEDGRILRLSPAAEAVARQDDGLAIRGSRLIAASPDCDAKLQAAISGAIRDQEAGAGAVAIVRHSGRQPFRLMIHPLARTRRFLAPDEAAALVRIVDAAAGPSPQPFAYGLFGLTARECEVAEHLLAGHSLETLAAALGIRHNTARNHLQSLFRKTGCNRQSDLVRRLMATSQSLR